MSKTFISLILSIVFSMVATAGEIACEAKGFPGHLQGIAADSTGIYWSFYDTIVKTDFTGKTLVSVKSPRHSGDLCVANGTVCVSVMHYDKKMEQEAGAKGNVYVYDTNLKLIKKVPLPETPTPDGITFLNGKFYIAGDDFGYEPHPLNSISVYDADLKFERKITIDIGKPTQYGVQTLNAFDGRILGGFYAKNGSAYFLIPPELKAGEAFPISVNVGFAFVPEALTGGRKLFLVAQNVGKQGDWGASAIVYELKDGKPVPADFVPQPQPDKAAK